MLLFFLAFKLTLSDGNQVKGMAFNKGISLNPREERNNAGIVDVIFYFLDLNRIRKSREFRFSFLASYLSLVLSWDSLILCFIVDIDKIIPL